MCIVPEKCRHILSLSGGKDSTALALYMRDKVSDMEYVFCDTGEELRETYDYLLKLEAHLGTQIKRLNPERPFKHYLQVYRDVLPDPKTRWCTKMLKLRPFERYVGDDPVLLYVGIRADEPHRTGYISTKPNIQSCFPFVKDGLRKKDIMRILHNTGLGLPEYYKWRSRSGCYFCFFQQRREWIGLMENHPNLYSKAMKMEKENPLTGARYTWVPNESLAALAARSAEIKAEYVRRCTNAASFQRDATLADIYETEDDDSTESCIICHL